METKDLKFPRRRRRGETLLVDDIDETHAHRYLDHLPSELTGSTRQRVDPINEGVDRVRIAIKGEGGGSELEY
jgi:hypothetical protein